MFNRSLKQTAISLSSCEAEFCASSAGAGELYGLAELFEEYRHTVSVRVEINSNSTRQKLKRPGGPEHVESRCVAVQQWTREKRLSAGRVDTKSNTADLFTKCLEGPRTLSLAKKLGLHVTGSTDH